MRIIVSLILLISLSQPAISQSYECIDADSVKFHMVITNDAYNLVVDSFIIITKLDTVIFEGDTTKYFPMHPEIKDTMYICNKTKILLFGFSKGSEFRIVRELTSEEEQIIFNKKLYLLDDN